MPQKPVGLKIDDTVGVIAPASPPNQDSLERGIQFLEESLGLRVKKGRYLYEKNGYLAGNDSERLEDFHNMFLDDEVKAVFCGGGGYGTARIAERINFEIVKKHPKIFWGYSDITFLHTAIRQKCGLVTFHGPMLASDIGKEGASPVSKQFFNQLFREMPLSYSEEISPLKVHFPGIVSGELTGGNLTLITSTLGTDFEIETEGKLLLIEDINEEPRAIDRMLNQLYMAGKLTAASGIVVADFNNCVPERDESLSLDEVLTHYFGQAGRPAMSGFKIGHCSPHISVPLGARAELDTSKKELRVESGINTEGGGADDEQS
ncbi:S66 peptidase family protein [Mesobacillus zeae]|uniref:LD-carboxypeptidase n=1 Tax=Mesobacillus zeae TaxID=1917180 RepID=A0A398B7K5_9BACI|nr:LD-carboxypeptidase [Mesobacillus zeae]RID85832.1 LD-carboxypeptidase [Mesobacillus zeae]